MGGKGKGERVKGKGINLIFLLFPLPLSLFPFPMPYAQYLVRVPMLLAKQLKIWGIAESEDEF